MRRLSRGQLILVLAVVVPVMVTAATGAFVAVVDRPPASPPVARATRSPSPSELVPFVPTPGPPATVCLNVADWQLDRRLEQLLIVAGSFANLNASADQARAGVGAFVFFGRPPAADRARIEAGLAALRRDAAAGDEVVPWMSTDEEGGSIQRLAGVLGPLPPPREMAGRWTPDQIRAAVAAHATAMRSLGVDVDLAPVLDVAPPGDQVADEAERSFSDDPTVVTMDGIAYAAGLASGGVVAVVKHFPGLGHADANTDLAASTDPSLDRLAQDDLIPFQQAFAAQVPAVMVSHVRVPGLSGSVPASLAPATYALLRGEFGFTGVAMTDALNARAIAAAGYSQPQAAVASIRAGADLAMIDSAQWQPTLAALRAAVRSGTLSEAVVDAAVRHVLSAKDLAVCPVPTA